MKTKAEYGRELYSHYVFWKNYGGKIKSHYAKKMKVTDAMLRATEK
jgi:hypothetical protein